MVYESGASKTGSCPSTGTDEFEYHPTRKPGQSSLRSFSVVYFFARIVLEISRTNHNS
jgi:hypothetical protein